MTDNATPKPRAYSRPTKYPNSIPRVMTTDAQRAELDAFAAEREMTLGEAVRFLIAEGLKLRAYREGRARTLPE